MKEVLQVCTMIITVLATVAAAIFAIGYGWSRTEIAECYTWQDQAEQFPGYYLTRWQANQCNANGIEILAPVVDRAE